MEKRSWSTWLLLLPSLSNYPFGCLRVQLLHCLPPSQEPWHLLPQHHCIGLVYDSFCLLSSRTFSASDSLWQLQLLFQHRYRVFKSYFLLSCPKTSNTRQRLLCFTHLLDYFLPSITWYLYSNLLVTSFRHWLRCWDGLWLSEIIKQNFICL